MEAIQNTDNGRRMALRRYAHRFLQSYLECAIWSSTHPDTEEPLDSEFSVDEIADESFEKAKADCVAFIWAHRTELAMCRLTAERAGHDFWLTRNGHGAGFWDEGLGRLGDFLTRECKAYGSCDLYPEDDGALHFS